MMTQQVINSNFTLPLLHWFDGYGRKALPWQTPKTPYRVYVSEIMLQQTQVKTVIPYFEAFMKRFPTLQTLALATEDQVFAMWSGLGYYSRARNLHQAAKKMVQEMQGIIPKDTFLLTQLPGIGPSTAAAIASLAYGQYAPILDGNVKRVLARYFMIDGEVNKKSTETKLYDLATQCMSKKRCADYTQAIMDLGALCCKPKSPTCKLCPLNDTCQAYKLNCIERYPQKKQTKTLPTQHWHAYIFYTQLQTEEKPLVYLEKREGKGVWQGLWSLPTAPINEEVSPCSHPFQHQADEMIPFMQIKHTFTHFHLQLQAMRLKTPIHEAKAQKGKWVSEETMASMGLPKPIKTLLTRFWSPSPTS